MNYTATAKKAAAMIRRAGCAMTLRVTTPGAYDPATGAESGATVADYACVGLLQTPGYKDSGVTFQDGSMVQASDRSTLIGASGLGVVPKPGDQIIVSGVTWDVMLVQTTSPGGVDLLHKCFMRRA